MSTPIIQHALREHAQVIQAIDAMIPEIEKLAGRIHQCLQRGGKVIWMGNGGSAADSQHLAAEFVGRFVRERVALASIALTTDTSILTSVGNDYGFEQIFSRQVEALCTDKDVLVGISTSGNSANVVRAIEAGKRLGATTVALTGEGGGKLAELCDVTLAIPSRVTARVQEAHILIGHILCELTDHAYTTA